MTPYTLNKLTCYIIQGKEREIERGQDMMALGEE